MTVIAWDGKELVADRMMQRSGVKSEITKIHRLKDGSLFGGAGWIANLFAMKEWIEAGADPEKVPAEQKDDATACDIIVITKAGKVLCYESNATPIPEERKLQAIGSGKEMALMAMHLGKSAEEAVLATCELRVDCGMGINKLTLKTRK